MTSRTARMAAAVARRCHTSSMPSAVGTPILRMCAACALLRPGGSRDRRSPPSRAHHRAAAAVCGCGGAERSIGCRRRLLELAITLVADAQDLSDHILIAEIARAVRPLAAALDLQRR